ncbi:RT0821/Lpp0805 family surface protein [Roseibium litorale]|uniref:Surface antigen domain-containing protein n=1 Tax=Roseibium litorale TaxID=2803841 RepID=A0ABR9CRU5_9HYPH|nr:RT0821/Lpp0805 family surface protein [Roseibium litorale]MBD8893478.1 hypothetical protein [Roseibium litorale]
MRFLPAAATVLMMSAALAGCSSVSGDGQASSWAGSSGVAEAEASTAIAVLLNNEFGQSLDVSDHKAVAEAQRQALRSPGVGNAVAWQNGATGRSGQVRPGPIYQVNDTTCREFVHEMNLSSRHLVSRGTACRQDDGSWKTLG